MILDCPTCGTRYLVQIGLFAQGGRQVRCARCKYEWHAKLPTSIDVVTPPPEFADITAALQKTPESSPFFAQSSPPLGEPTESSSATPEPPPGEIKSNLPALIKDGAWKKKALKIVACLCVAAGLLSWPILDRQPIVKAIPSLRGLYEGVGLAVPPAWDGLTFENVKSELRYDSGTMKLFVDGEIRNGTGEVQLIPDIRARALGVDQRIVQSWWVEPPAVTIVAGGVVPFHTEVASPMERTIENVSLEFFTREEKADVSK